MSMLPNLRSSWRRFTKVLGATSAGALFVLVSHMAGDIPASPETIVTNDGLAQETLTAAYDFELYGPVDTLVRYNVLVGVIENPDGTYEPEFKKLAGTGLKKDLHKGRERCAKKAFEGYDKSPDRVAIGLSPYNLEFSKEKLKNCFKRVARDMATATPAEISIFMDKFYESRNDLQRAAFLAVALFIASVWPAGWGPGRRRRGNSAKRHGSPAITQSL